MSILCITHNATSLKIENIAKEKKEEEKEPDIEKGGERKVEILRRN
jgi:hypothetical protein